MAEAKSKEETELHWAEPREAGGAWPCRAAGQGCGGAEAAVRGWTSARRKRDRRRRLRRVLGRRKQALGPEEPAGPGYF